MLRRFVEIGSVGANGLASFRLCKDTRTVPSDPKAGVTSSSSAAIYNIMVITKAQIFSLKL